MEKDISVNITKKRTASEMEGIGEYGKESGWIFLQNVFVHDALLVHHYFFTFFGAVKRC